MEQECIWGVGIEEERGRRKEGRGEDQYFVVLGRHLETRAESTISISLKAISAAERTGGLPCVDSVVGEEVAGTGAEEEIQRLDEGQVQTKMSVFGRVFQRHEQHQRFRQVWGQFRPLSGQMASGG